MHLAAAVAVVACQLTFVAYAAAPDAGSASVALSHSSIACSITSIIAAPCEANPVASGPQLKLPSGSGLCPASGPAAACTGNDRAIGTAPGVSSVPSGQSACASQSTAGLPSTPAACSNVVLTPDPIGQAGGRGSSAGSSGVVLPSVPAASLQPALPVQRLALDADTTTVGAGHQAVLTATASEAVSGNSAIEIFDQTSGTLAGACTQVSQCLVGYAARGGVHTFAAYITAPTTQQPASLGMVSSNRVSVGWLDSTIAADSTVVGPGHPVTITATSTVDVARTGRRLEIYDLTAKTMLTYCSRGTSCTTSVTQATGGAHDIVGYVTGRPEAVSTAVRVTWLTIALSASTTTSNTGGLVYLRATTNADITTTPWVVGIYDDRGRLVDHACKTGRSCSVQTWVTGAAPWYSAEVGALPAPAQRTPLTKLLSNLAPGGLADVQAHSSSVQPTRLLWGVDSCKAFTQDSAGATGLLPQVTAAYGGPDFWGRYLTDTVCPGISAAEIAAAARDHMGILPIYNDYDCSAVSSYATGRGYAASASAAAASLGIPKGRVIAVDIEPPGAACPGAAGVDSGFIEGWYDGIFAAGYAPAFYGNGTNGSEFGTAWCTAVTALPNIARDSYLWSFEPSLQGSYVKAAAPEYLPYNTGCAGVSAAWQYQLSAGSDPDVDTDLALSALPLWYP
jgi:hypothetical protein